MVKIRLTKIGKRNAPAYRIVAINSRRKRDGRALEIIGHYNPQMNPPDFKYNKERLEYWISQGAKMSKAVIALIEGKYEYKKYVPKKAEESQEDGKTADRGEPEKGGEVTEEKPQDTAKNSENKKPEE